MSAAPQVHILLQEAHPRQPGGYLAGLRREWRLASWSVRFSTFCLLLFYLLAIASPVIAPYDPTYQNRRLPDCPPMSLHLSAPSEWSRAFFYAYPMQMIDAQARKFAEDRGSKTYVHLLSFGHLFTTEPGAPPFFLLGSEGLGRDLFGVGDGLGCRQGLGCRGVDHRRYEDHNKQLKNAHGASK